MTEDDQLMLQIQAGESRAFEELVERHQGGLLSFFQRNTRDAQLAEDLAQETLLRVYNQAWDYLPRGHFRGWMYRVARNLMIDSFRRRSHDALVHAVRGRSEEADVLARVAAEVLSPQQRAHESELAGIVDEMLDQIPEDQRLTFTLHHFAELSLAEVAEIMETSVATCKSRLRLAREKLRGKLIRRGLAEAGSARAEGE